MECPVCPALIPILKSEIEFLRERVAFLEQQNVNLADPLALARAKAITPRTSQAQPEDDRRAAHSPGAIRAMVRDMPTDEERASHAALRKLESLSAEPEPPVSRAEIEDAFLTPGI